MSIFDEISTENTMPKPAQLQSLEKTFGLSLTRFTGADLSDLMTYACQNQYALDATGETVLGLNLRSNDLKDEVLEPVFQMTGLQALNLSENALSSAVFPQEMSALRYLDISECKSLKKVALPSDHTLRLISLDLHECAIESFALPSLLLLEYFDISRNGLKELLIQGACQKLVMFDASDNQLEEFDLNGLFPDLKYLYLNGNRLREIHFKDLPPALEVLHLKGNQLENLPPGLEEIKTLKTLYLHGNPLSRFEKEVIAGGEMDNSRDTVIAFLEGRHKSKGKLIPLLEAKMVLVGNGEVGKSSIRIRLLDETAPLPDEKDRTPALEIAKLTLENLDTHLTGLADPINFTLNIWDFGGQGRYREIQQFFCSRKSLYLFVTATDDKPDKEDYINFDYWLSMVNGFGYDKDSQSHCPVIYVMNKIDLVGKGNISRDAADIGEKSMRSQFPNIRQFIKISCEERINLAELKAGIREHLPEISKDIFAQHGYPGHWIAVKNWLDTFKSASGLSENTAGLHKNYMPYPDYEAACMSDRFGLSSNEARQWLVILDRIGSVVYLEHNEELSRWVILNPNWIKDGIVKALDSKFIKKGVLTSDLFEVIWPDNNTDEHQIFISLMLAYKLCYQRNDSFGDTELVVPALLPDEQPTLDVFFTKPAFRLKLAYDPFIPAGTVNKLIVRLHSEQGGETGIPKDMVSDSETHLPVSVYNNLMWKNNVIVHMPGTNNYAHAREQWEDQCVYVDLFGDDPKPLFTRLKSLLEQDAAALKEARYMNKLELEDWGYHEQHEEKWIPLKYKPEFFFNPIQHPGTLKKSKIFISYAHADGEQFKNKLVTHLSTLRNGKLIEDWNDRNIVAGDWNSQIEKTMHQADIFLLLITPGFLESGYINSKELKTAYQKYKAGAAKIFPVVCDFCDWELLPVTDADMEVHPTLNRSMKVWLGKFQPFPKGGKPVTDKNTWQSENEAFLDVINGLKREIM